MTLRFRDDGTFRVLQMADIQDGPSVNADTIRLIEAAVRAADPDLVVFTGDQIRGYDAAYIDTFLRRRGDRPGERIRLVTTLEGAAKGIRPATTWEVRGDGGAPGRGLDALLEASKLKVRTTFSAFLAPIIRAGVPFAATYGNHDFQCGILADEQDDMYREFDGCLNPPSNGLDPLAKEPGTFALPVLASRGGRIAMSVTMVNSGDYADRPSPLDPERNASEGNSHGLDLADSDGYGTPSENALDWLAQVQRELGSRNGDGRPVPSIAFQHIPPQEFYDCLAEVPAWTPNAVEGNRKFAGRCYVLNPAICRPGSRLGEGIGCADENVGEVEVLRKAGGYFALFCGHDHKNAFVGRAHGIDLGYAPTCGFESYGPKSRLRGIRLFEFNEGEPAAYTTHMLTWGDLIGRYSSDEFRVFFQDHLTADGVGVRDQLRRPAVFATLAGAALLIVRSVVRGLRNRFH